MSIEIYADPSQFHHHGGRQAVTLNLVGGDAPFALQVADFLAP